MMDLVDVSDIKGKNCVYMDNELLGYLIEIL